MILDVRLSGFAASVKPRRKRWRSGNAGSGCSPSSPARRSASSRPTEPHRQTARYSCRGDLGGAIDDRFGPPLLAVNLDRMVVHEVFRNGLGWNVIQVFVVGRYGLRNLTLNCTMNCHCALSWT